jgi:hypothetical protein
MESLPALVTLPAGRLDICPHAGVAAVDLLVDV